MSQNGQTHFKNLAAFPAKFLKPVDDFGTLCIKGLNSPKIELVSCRTFLFL